MESGHNCSSHILIAIIASQFNVSKSVVCQIVKKTRTERSVKSLKISAVTTKR